MNQIYLSQYSCQKNHNRATLPSGARHSNCKHKVRVAGWTESRDKPCQINPTSLLQTPRSEFGCLDGSTGPEGLIFCLMCALHPRLDETSLTMHKALRYTRQSIPLMLLKIHKQRAMLSLQRMEYQKKRPQF